MAVALYLVSTRAFSGKNLFALTLGKDAQQRGLRVKYLRPLGPHPTQADGILTDRDVLCMAESLKLDTPPADLCPVPLTEELTQQALSGQPLDALANIRATYDRLAADADVVLIGGIGSLFTTGAIYGASSREIADLLGARALVIARYEVGRTPDELLSSCQALGDHVAGAVINGLLPKQRRHIEETLIPYFEGKNIPIFGALPDDPVLHAVSVQELIDTLKAKVLTGEEHLGDLVERFSIGAMYEEAALTYFRKVNNKGVITGGDRSDIQRAALETSTRVLVLTGGIQPANFILSLASERKVPVLLVSEDTLTTVERIEKILEQMRIFQPRKTDRAMHLVHEHVNLERLWKTVGVI
ncbi:MAG TPA: phosphotransacetylase family protein [Armatimonadota bacterium]